MSQLLVEKLFQHFGFRQFRPGQSQAIHAAIQGRDVIVVMPTGSGKSLCYQLPGLELRGTTVVISPLIALMQDQVTHLQDQGFRAAAINSSLSASELQLVESEIAIGNLEFIFTTPERIATAEFRDRLSHVTIDLFVVDEAHCVSQWGHDFRPDYLSLGNAIEALGSPPVMAMTASATDEILADIQSELRIPDAKIVHTGFDRPNLSLQIIEVETEKQKDTQLSSLIPSSGSGIIYCATTAAVDRVSEFLSQKGIKAVGYHGRMSAKRRSEAQSDFMSDNVNVMVATNAFGLGIDKPDIRFVVHYHLPGSLEAYYQECGRAGRDGHRSMCIGLHTASDSKLQRFLQSGSYPDESDLVNAYHTLQLAAEHHRWPTAKHVFDRSPLSQRRMKICLTLFENKGIVQRDRRAGYRLIRSKMSRDELASLGQSYRLREERQAIRQRNVEEYAMTSGCRWNFILRYFGDSESAQGRCGRCDNCETGAANWIAGISTDRPKE